MRILYLSVVGILLLVIAVAEGVLLVRTYNPNGSRSTALQYDPEHPYSFHFHRGSAWERFFQDILGNQVAISAMNNNIDRYLRFSRTSDIFGKQHIEDRDQEISLIFDFKENVNSDYSVRVKGNEIIFSGRGQEYARKITTAPWPFEGNVRETDAINEANWEQIRVFPVPAGADAQHFRVERNQGSLAITFQKIRST